MLEMLQARLADVLDTRGPRFSRPREAGGERRFRSLGGSRRGLCGQATAPGGIQPRDALGERRGRREERVESARRAAEEHVTRFGSRRALDLGSLGRASDSLQRPRDSARVPGELDRGRIGQELALAADRGLDQISEQRAHEADQHQAPAHDHESRTGVVASRAPAAASGKQRGAQQEIPDDAEQQDAVQHAHQA